MKDVKWMQIQRQYEACSTPQELYEALPQIQPLDRGTFLTPVSDGVYKFRGDMFDLLPRLPWYQLYNMAPKDKAALPAVTVK